MHSNFIINNS